MLAKLRNIKSCKIKKKIVEKDEKETALRKVLNFGHTFGHAYEAGLGYSHKLNHGEAVILGMKTALNFSLWENNGEKLSKTNKSTSIKSLREKKIKKDEIFSLIKSIESFPDEL